jgi:N4-gp56 family major capsid protein
MADTRPATGLNPTQWDDDYNTEYFQENPFLPDMGSDSNSIIQIKEDFKKGKGDNMTLALVGRMASDDGVEGTDVLEGAEEALDTRSFNFTVNKRRKGVRIAEMDEYKSSIDLRNAGKDVLMDWSQENTKKRILTALGSINGVAYASATSTQRNAWVVDNEDRVLFGATTANYSATHATAVSNVDNTDDKLTPAALSLMKRLALKARTTAGKRKIRPIRVAGQNRRWFKVYAGPGPFRDLKNSAEIQQAQREVGLQMENNRLFQGGDLVWDGMIIHEVDDLAPLTGVGAGSIDVGQVFLCGAQALVYGIGKRWTTKTKTFDYGDKFGVIVEEICGIHKCRYGSGAADTDDLTDHGVVTGFFASVGS